jgi:ubiquinone/menaquinone biosynthesis C-methylase UbiE
VCQQRPDTVYTVASLLDHMDWMPPFMINEEFHWLQKRMCPEKGRCFWRSFSEEVHSAPLVWLKPTRVEDTGDRVAMYWSTWMAPMNKDTVRFQLANRSWGAPVAPQSLLASLATGVKIVAFPVLQSLLQWRVKDRKGIQGHASKMEAFYESQKDEYDAFRESFLHARSTLIDCVPIQNRKQVWIDVGGGTGRNLEFLTPETIRAYFSKVYIVDVSPSLLEVAKARVEKAGLKDIVECVFCDFTNAQAVKDKLPASGTVDLITFSYSLSMIPNKTAALEQASVLLKPKGQGVMGIADFWFGGGRRAALGKGDRDGVTNVLTRIYCHATRLWFKQDGVILLREDMLDPVRSKFDFDGVPTEKFRRRVPLLPFLRPWHGVQMATTK